MAYVVIENTPGYLPDDDDPYVTDDLASRGYRILSRLSKAGYKPGLGLQQGRFESEAQRDIYRALLAHRKTV